MLILERAALFLAGLGILCAPAARVHAQQHASLIERWQARATETQNRQPHWATPVATSTPKLDQSMRTEFVRQVNSSNSSTWNLGNNKGLELIPSRHTQIIVGLPPFFHHTQPGVADGFGDFWLQGKYRIYARDEQHGNIGITVIVYATLPTGKNSNGQCCAVVTPTIAAGKGVGRFALMSTLGGSLPASNAAGIGRSILWNSVLQYHVGERPFTRLLSPEVEFNTSFFHGGSHSGKAMMFVTPGLVLGRIPLSHDADGKPGRRALTLSAGEQIAVTRFHTYDHGLILGVRLPF
jgi:hypothetical protein